MIYLDMFLVFFQVGALSFGGGYAAMPIIQRLVVEERAWLTMAEFADLQTIAEMTPGPNMLNAATFTGLRMTGIGGSLICTFGCVLPSLLIVLVLAVVYEKYRDLDGVKIVLAKLRPAVVSMIANAAVAIFLMAMFGTVHVNRNNIQDFRIIEGITFLICLYFIRKKNVSPIKVIIATAIIAPIFYFI